MKDNDDIAIHDAQLLEEIELLGDLIVLASGTQTRLSRAQIDDALGVRPETVHAPV